MKNNGKTRDIKRGPVHTRYRGLETERDPYSDEGDMVPEEDVLRQLLTISALFGPRQTGMHCLKSQASMIILRSKGGFGLPIRCCGDLSSTRSWN